MRLFSIHRERRSRTRLLPVPISRFLIMAGLMLTFFSARNLLLAWADRDLIAADLSGSGAAQEGEPVRPLSFDAKPGGDVELLDEAEKIARLLAFAANLEGSPYRASGCDPQGFDCSGFVQYCFQQALGMELPRSSRGMAKIGEAVAPEEARAGDLLFFTGADVTSGRIGHVAILVERDGQRMMMIHTSSSRGVITENMHALAYYRERFRQVRRPEYD